MVRSIVPIAFADAEGESYVRVASRDRPGGAEQRLEAPESEDVMKAWAFALAAFLVAASTLSAQARSVMLRRAFAFVVLLGLGACSSPTAPDAPCGAEVSLVASSGTKPTFSWTPDCGVAQLTVTTLGDSFFMWTVTSAPFGIGSGVKYGDTPKGASLTRAPTPLQDGVTYQVTIQNNNGDRVGLAVFTP